MQNNCWEKLFIDANDVCFDVYTKSTPDVHVIFGPLLSHFAVRCQKSY